MHFEEADTPDETGPSEAAEPNDASPQSPESFSTDSDRIEADELMDDEGYAESTTTSYVSSIASSIRRGIEENGRIYAAYGQHKPWLPVDDMEVCFCEAIVLEMR